MGCEKFKEDKGCVSKGLCAAEGQCQNALIIAKETEYLEGGQPSSLEYQIENPQCGHPTVKKAIKKGKTALSTKNQPKSSK